MTTLAAKETTDRAHFADDIARIQSLDAAEPIRAARKTGAW